MSLLQREHPSDDDLQVRLVRERDRGALAVLLDDDPLVNVVVAARLHTARSLDTDDVGGPVLGAWNGDDQLVGAVFHGGTVMPIGGTDAVWRALAERLLLRGRGCSSIVGRADAVQAMWRVLRTEWPKPRAIRERQLLLELDLFAYPTGGDPRVRALTPDEFDQYLPAASAMFTEELGIPPTTGSSTAGYHRRLAGLLRRGHALGVIDTDGSVLFKADIGAVSARTCQLQGVWVRPDQRGQGLGTAAMPPVLRCALGLAPSVSLYVNDFNTPARRMYERLGMRHAATLSTILF